MLDASIALGRGGEILLGRFGEGPDILPYWAVELMGPRQTPSQIHTGVYSELDGVTVAGCLV